MARKVSNGLVRALLNGLRQRDRLEMRVAGALLSAVERPRQRVTRRMKARRVEPRGNPCRRLTSS